MRKGQSLAKKKRLSKIIKQYHLPMIISNTAGGVEYINRRFTESFGYTIDDISTTEQWWKAIYPDEQYRILVQKSWDEAIAEVAETEKQIKTQEWDITCKDGSVRHVEFDVTAIDGVFLVTLNDVTEHKEAESNARKSAKKWQTTFDAMSDSVFIISNRGDILQYNLATLDLFGITEEEIKKKHCWEFIHDLSAPIKNCPIERMKRSKHRESLTFKRNNRWLEVSVDPVFNDIGEVICAIHVTSDVTEKNEIKEVIYQAQKMDSVGRLAGGVAHDFNNMMGVILGYTEMALKDVDPALPLYEQLQSIHKAAHRSAILTKQLLGFARKQTISPKKINLNDAVECMQKVLQQLIGENIDLVWKPTPEIWSIKMDPSQISQILANLCINAKDAIADIGKVTIETKNSILDESYCADHPILIPGEYTLLIVRDNGCGMDKDTMDKIYEPFFTTKELFKGSGLGLSAIYGIVKQNNGIINVDSKIGEGTTFEIYLPRYVAKPNRVDKKRDPAEPVTHDGETILLVEDEPAILRVTAAMLKSQNYTVLAASTPEKAISLTKEHLNEIDLLMTDVIMPKMNGCDLAKEISSLVPSIKFLFMSGYTADVIEQHGVLDEGINFIQKPFSGNPLYKKLRDILESK